MKSPTFSLFALLLLLNVVDAAAADSEAAKKDQAQLQGHWSMLSGTADGQPMPDSMLRGARRVCKGDQTTVTISGELFMQAKFTLDPSATPKKIDYQMIAGPTKGKQQLGIYQIEGDTVKFCF